MPVNTFEERGIHTNYEGVELNKLKMICDKYRDEKYLQKGSIQIIRDTQKYHRSLKHDMAYISERPYRRNR